MLYVITIPKVGKTPTIMVADPSSSNFPRVNDRDWGEIGSFGEAMSKTKSGIGHWKCPLGI